MPETDSSQVHLNDIIATLRQDAKDVHEQFQTHLLTENERLQNANDLLLIDLQTTRDENSRLSVLVTFYETANWFYIAGTVVFAITSLLSSRVTESTFWILFCIAVILVGAGAIAWISKKRQDCKINRNKSRAEGEGVR